MDRRNFLKLLSLFSYVFIFNERPSKNMNNNKYLLKEVKEIFGTSEQNIERILSHALRKNGDFSEIFYEFIFSTSLSYKNGILLKPVIMSRKGVGVRVIEEEKSGYAFSDSLDRNRILKAADNAAEIAQSKSEFTSLNLKLKDNFKSFYPQDVISNIPIKKKISLLKKSQQVLNNKKDILRNEISYNDCLKIKLIANSEGLLTFDIQPLVEFDVMVLLNKNGKRVKGYEGRGSRLGIKYFDNNKPEKIAEHAYKKARVQLFARELTKGEFPVVFAAGQSGKLFHKIIGHPLEADFNKKRISVFSGKIGQKISNSKLTIIDAGNIPYKTGSINIDDEGFKGRSNVLVEKGKLVSYVHDRLSCKYYRVKPTGNGRRESYDYQPFPRMTNLYLGEGKYHPDEIIGSVKKGIYVADINRGKVNIADGNFIFKSKKSYFIENGEIKYPLKEITLVGNTMKILNKVSMIGNDLNFSNNKWKCEKNNQKITVGMGNPTIKFSKVSVTG